MLQQIFMTAVAAAVFFILITKIASVVTNGHKQHRTRSHVSSKLLGEEVMEKSNSKRKTKSKSKSKKKVRFAVDDEALIVNKVVAGPSESEGCGGDDDENEKNCDEREEGKSENVGDDDDGMRMRMREEQEQGWDDEWEGVERSDLEKAFVKAADYGKMDDHLQSLGSDIQMQLYGLHKVATEGPCREPQPMPLKLSARAKWNAWQKLGNMNPDMAMEQYISLLSDKLPQWQSVSVGTDTTTSSILLRTESCREGEIDSSSDVIGISDSVNKDQQ